MTIKEILEFNFLNVGNFQISLYHIIALLFIYAIARGFVFVAEKFLKRYFTFRNIDQGRSYAFRQFIKYIVYTGAVLIAMESIGIQISVIWGGAAALLVGIGLGLQQTFNDLISGIILLMEGTVEVGDIIQVEGMVGVVQSIGIRTSKIETRDNISKLVPNSKLVGETATNWSHTDTPTRFAIEVGVSYDAKPKQVTNLLLQAANEQKSILQDPLPRVKFDGFGNSSLDFILYFYSNELWGIEWTKSELRYRIFALFEEHSISIPFPQHDLWIRNAEALQGFSSNTIVKQARI